VTLISEVDSIANVFDLRQFSSKQLPLYLHVIFEINRMHLRWRSQRCMPSLIAHVKFFAFKYLSWTITKFFFNMKVIWMLYNSKTDAAGVYRFPRCNCLAAQKFCSLFSVGSLIFFIPISWPVLRTLYCLFLTILDNCMFAAFCNIYLEAPLLVLKNSAWKENQTKKQS
jgi:hypothetical protein